MGGGNTQITSPRVQPLGLLFVDWNSFLSVPALRLSTVSGGPDQGDDSAASDPRL